ncbi:uncharacterized protein LOC114573419 [Perca flavescens]|uniref:uncharacterized protein LOC114573419 n=1 Tax=Perca flavescens TaxID=8167 RepID=UPI00106E7F29|nr:uncharacterized protein LOC114573419 [Perca flavescens]
MMTSFYEHKIPLNLGSICLQLSENCSPKPRETKTLSDWKHFDGKGTRVDFLDEKEAERCRSARKILPKCTTKMDLFQHDIFHNQKVLVGDVQRFSKHLVAETRGPAKLSAVPTKEVKPSEKTRPTGPTDVEIHLPEVDLETDRGQEQRPKRGEEVRSDSQEDMRTPPPQEEGRDQAEEDLQEQQSLRQVWQKIQTEDLNEFQNIADLAETIKELEKEALRQKEGYYEKWVAERGLSVPDSSPQKPKKRMSKWEKRFLRVKDVFCR